MMRWIKRTLVVLLVLVLLVAIGGTGLFYAGYTYYFSSHFDAGVMEPEPSDFPGLQVEEGAVVGNKGQELKTFLYSKEGVDPKGVVLISHGLGGGHGTYMDVADFVTDHGYYAFAYDATGSGASTGKTGGLSQGILDLEQMVDQVGQDPRLQGLPLMVFGHSWGAHNAGAVLHTRGDAISAFALVAGWDDQIDMLIAFVFGAEESQNPFLRAMAGTVEWLKFGQYAKMTVVEGVENSGVPGIFVHSADDDVVPPAFGHEVFYAAFGQDPAYDFLYYQDKGHMGVLQSPEAQAYNDALMAYVGAQEAGDPKDHIRAYLAEHGEFDPEKTINTETMNRVIDVFDASIA